MLHRYKYQQNKHRQVITKTLRSREYHSPFTIYSCQAPLLDSSLFKSLIKDDRPNLSTPRVAGTAVYRATVRNLEQLGMKDLFAEAEKAGVFADAEDTGEKVRTTRDVVHMLAKRQFSEKTFTNLG